METMLICYQTIYMLLSIEKNGYLSNLPFYTACVVLCPSGQERVSNRDLQQC